MADSSQDTRRPVLAGAASAAATTTPDFASFLLSHSPRVLFKRFSQTVQGGRLLGAGRLPAPELAAGAGHRPGRTWTARKRDLDKILYGGSGARILRFRGAWTNP